MRTAFQVRRVPKSTSKEESPSILKLREAAVNTVSKAKLSPFNLISWNQKARYHNPT